MKDAAYAFFSYLSQPAQSGHRRDDRRDRLQPYRTSQLTYGDTWKNGGMSEKAAGFYLGAIKASLNSPNMILDLRIPQNQKYQQVVLDEAVSRFLSGEIDEEATVKAVADGWNDLNEQIGKDEPAEVLQRHARRAALTQRSRRFSACRCRQHPNASPSDTRA